MMRLSLFRSGRAGKRLLRSALVLGILLLPAGPPVRAAGPVSPDAIAGRLQQAYDQARSLSARFHQVATMRINSRKREADGTVVILKPGRIRWDYLAPDRQVLIGDPNRVLMYFAKSAQMIIRPLDEYLRSDVTYSFFTGAGNIRRDFKVLAPDAGVLEEAGPAGGKKPRDYCIKLVPKKTHPQVDYLHLWVDPATFLITRLMIVDQFGSVTDLRFSDLKVNRKVPAGTFSFTPPAGTEIIRE